MREWLLSVSCLGAIQLMSVITMTRRHFLQKLLIALESMSILSLMPISSQSAVAPDSETES